MLGDKIMKETRGGYAFNTLMAFWKDDLLNIILLVKYHYVKHIKVAKGKDLSQIDIQYK